MTAYPTTLYDQGDDILRSLGSFWAEIFEDRDRLAAFFRAYGLEAGQAYRWYLEHFAALSRYTIPLYHTEEWYYLRFRVSQLTEVWPVFGDGGEYTYQPGGYHFGRPIGVPRYGIPLPPGLKRVRLITDRVTEPRLCYCENMEFHVNYHDNRIELISNPLDTDLLEPRSIIDDDGNVVDVETGLWLYAADFDLDWLWEQYGYVLRLRSSTSRHYRGMINARFDSNVGTTTVESLQDMLEAVSGIPLARYDETVEHILTGPGRVQVVTDLSVYTFPADSTVIVAAGDELHPGDSMVDTVIYHELGRDQSVLDQLPAVALGDGFLAGGYSNELTFENKKVSIDYLGVDEDDKAIITFEVSGVPADVAKFWSEVHTYGKNAGKVLADWLDTRLDPVGPPAPGDLPATINPLKFVLGRLMANNLFILRLRPEKFAADAPGLAYMDQLYHILPPQTTFIVYLELEADPEYIDPTQAGDADHAGVDESLDGYDSAGAITEPEVGPDTPVGVEELLLSVRTADE